MSTIHHATQKKADKENVKLMTVGTGAATLITAQAGSCKITHPEAKVALEAAMLGRALEAEYPALTLGQVEGEFVVHANGDELWGPTSYVPTLADLLELCEEEGLDPEEGLKEIEEEERRVVVAQAYKDSYRERGNPDHCGDWLASVMDGQFARIDRGGKESFDPDAFLDFLRENGVEVAGKWANLPNSGQRGWQGRFRMNGRQKLEPIVALVGLVTLGGKQVQVPEGELASLRAKHAKYIAKHQA